MTPKKLVTARAGQAQARVRRRVAQKYLEVAELVQDEGGSAVNVCVGLAVLAGIAAGDAICIVGTGERYAGQDHHAAAELLERVDADLGKRLRRLIALKPSAHYGDDLLDEGDRTKALRAASALVAAALERAP